MAVTTRYTGRDLYVSWVYASGTVNLSADFRNLSIEEPVDEADTTAGNDTYANSIATFSDASATLEYLDITGSTGSTQWVALAPRTSGTLFWYPTGTASNQYYESAPGWVRNRSREIPYDDVVSCTAEFKLTAAPTYAKVA